MDRIGAQPNNRRAGADRAILHAVISLFLLGIGHRLAQLALLWPDLRREIVNGVRPLMGALSPAIMTEHPWWGLWYLQQFPLIPNAILTLINGIAHSPEWIVLDCIGLEMLISSATAAAMALILWRLNFRAGVALGAALIFLLSDDLLMIEYDTFGQMFHNTLTMLLLVLLCLAAPRLHRERTPWQAACMGMLVGLLFLNRASFSFFAPVVLVWLIAMGCWRRPALLAVFLAPIVVLQGGWILKNYLIFGYVSPNSSSWGGANLLQGERLRHGSTEFHDWVASRPGLCASPWYEMTVDPPPGPLPTYLLPTEWPQGLIPKQVMDKDDEIARHRGGHIEQFDTLAATLWSNCAFKEIEAYWLHRPALAIWETWQSYKIYWHPIRQFVVILPAELKPDMELYSSDFNLLKNLENSLDEIGQRHLIMWHPMRFEQLKDSDYRPAPIISLPVIPSTVSVLNFLILHSLPLLLLVRLWTGEKTPFPAVFWFMVMIYVYDAGVSCLGEAVENMRYRLEVEPIIWMLSIMISWHWYLCARRLERATPKRHGQVT
jgi:hypothetical protein